MTDSGMLEKPSWCDPSFMGEKNPTLGSVLAEIPALDHPPTQGSAGGSGIRPAGTGNSFSSLAHLCTTDLGLQEGAAAQMHYSGFPQVSPPLSHKIPFILK